MMLKAGLVLILLVFSLVFQIVSSEYVRGCYYTNWAQYRQSRGKYTPSEYVPGLCTHIFYAFAVMNPDFTVKPFEWNDEDTSWSVGMYSKVIGWKKEQPGLKVLLSFGGWTFSEGNVNLLRSMASTQNNRNVFISSVVQLIKKYGFDGFDIDWEYPVAEDKINFALLLKEFRKTFDSNVPRLLLTAAVTPNYQKIDIGYDTPVVASTLDMLNVMTYDFHGAWEMVTGHNSPLYERLGDKFSISDAVEAWSSKGIPKQKIMVGLASYGRGWTLATTDTKVGAPAKGPSNANLYTKLEGMISYYEACDYLSKGAQRLFDHEQVSPFIVSGNQWYSYDDIESIEIKLNWIKQNGYGGAFFWTLDFDDFNGKCHESNGQSYPLINLMSKIFSDDKHTQKTFGPVIPTKVITKPGNLITTDTMQSVTTVTDNTIMKQTTLPITGPFTCTGTGLFPDNQSCNYFYICDNNGIFHKLQCPGGLVFDPSTKVCDWPDKVNCKVA